MIYTVVWRPAAGRDLTELWLASPDRDEVAEAANAIDAVLRNDPASVGESRAGDIRILIVPPLAVLYEISEDDRLVSVFAVFRWPPNN